MKKKWVSWSFFHYYYYYYYYECNFPLSLNNEEEVLGTIWEHKRKMKEREGMRISLSV
jgi:hypothetical protein